MTATPAHRTQTAAKSVASGAAAVATVGAEILATGVLHGTAQTVVQCVVAALGVLGVHQATYWTRNKPTTGRDMHTDRHHPHQPPAA